MFSTVAQSLRHPYQLFQKLVHAADIRSVKQIPLGIEAMLHGRKVHIPEDRDQTEFTHYWKHIFDRARTAEWTSRDADNTDCFVDVLFQAAVQQVLQQPTVAVIIFG